MADWGLYSALRGTDNWQQKRQDKMQSLAIMKEMDQRAQQDLQQSMALEQGMQKYFDEMKNLDVLAEDQGRINDLERQARRKVMKGIAANNGNLKAYMASGGISAMSEYRNSVLNSETAKNAAQNKQIYNAWLKDSSDGKFIKGVVVDVPVMKDGKPVLDKDGKPKVERKRISMEEQHALFKKGIVNKLSYGGAEDMVKYDMFDFLKQPKNPNDPFTAYNVTTSDIQRIVASKGGSEEQQLAQARQYAGSIANGANPLKWGKEDYADYALKMAKAKKYSEGGAGKGRAGNWVLSQLKGAMDTLPINGKAPMGNRDIDWWRKNIGLDYIKSQRRAVPTSDLTGIDPITGTSFDVSNALDVKMSNNYIKHTDGKMYIPATVVYDADNPRPDNPHYEQILGWNNLKDEASSNIWDKYNIDETDIDYEAAGYDDGKDVWMGQVLIPIQPTLDNKMAMDDFNKFRNIQEKQFGTAPNYSNLDVAASAFEMVDYLVQDAMQAEGLSEDEARLQIMQEINLMR
jgi:hypothetical protein